jgi:hypothetical protein
MRRLTWERYATVFEEWNRDLMVNILILQQQYGTTKRDQFENIIQPGFSSVHECLEGVRRPSTTIACPLSATHDIKVINGSLDRLNQDLYCFVTGLPERGKERCFPKI